MIVEATKVTTEVVGEGGVKIWRYGDMEIRRYGDMEI